MRDVKIMRLEAVRHRSESMVAEWHHLHPDENAGNCKPNAPLERSAVADTLGGVVGNSGGGK